jgi:hypothetical protein
MPDDLKDVIKQNAEGPRSASGDAGSMQQHSLPDMVLADKHLAAKNAMTKRNFGLTRVQIIPPGTV